MDYLTHFGLTAAPFATTPDPRFAFGTREHEQAAAKIAYYTEERRGIFLVKGVIGSGKTTLSQIALSRWASEPERFTAAHVTDPSPRTPAAFLRLVLAAFGLPTTRNLLDLKASLRGFLAAEYMAGRTVILILDEAQTISAANLDTIQALANEQTQTAKLIQIVLFSQPNFDFKLAHKPALQSRIAGGTTLNALTIEESIGMMRYRMEVAGGDFGAVFGPQYHKAIYNATSGVPRNLCVFCDAVLINALSAGKKVADDEVVSQTLRDLDFKGWLKKGKLG